MTLADPLALESISGGTFHLYRVAILVCGLVVAALAGWGFGATVTARVISGATAVFLIGYSAYLWVFFDETTIYEVYPFLFILPILVVGYHFYTRAIEREADIAARRAFEAERAQRRAARAAQAEQAAAEQPVATQPEPEQPADPQDRP